MRIKMNRNLVLAICLALVSFLSQADAIDLDCPNFSSQLIEQLSSAGLLAEGASTKQAQSIGLKLCAGAQQSAQKQYEVGRQEALDNWFLEDMGGKPGNKRLKNLKR